MVVANVVAVSETEKQGKKKNAGDNSRPAFFVASAGLKKALVSLCGSDMGYLPGNAIQPLCCPFEAFSGFIPPYTPEDPPADNIADGR